MTAVRNQVTVQSASEKPAPLPKTPDPVAPTIIVRTPSPFPSTKDVISPPSVSAQNQRSDRS
jgi:hypothetical protein